MNVRLDIVDTCRQLLAEGGDCGSVKCDECPFNMPLKGCYQHRTDTVRNYPMRWSEKRVTLITALLKAWGVEL